MSLVRCENCGDFVESKEAFYDGNDAGSDVYYCIPCAEERGKIEDDEPIVGPTEEQLAHQWDQEEE